LTGIVVSFVNTPVELLKIRFQVETGANSRYTGLLDCGKQIVAQSGVRGLYQGYLATLTREIPAYAGYFFAYFGFRNLYLNDFKSVSSETIDLKREIPTWYLMVCGGVSGIACWLASYPQDVIKSRIQMSTASTTPNIRETISTIMKESSYRGFFKGLSPALIRAVPANAATFVVYEYAMRFMN
jgi:solute carrier family 25 carnitine/acylcarnitine transporter 20/29